MNHPKSKILIVEDDPAILKGLMDVLIFNGYAVDGEADGGKGLETGLSGVYDLIILDVMLPTLNGFDICKRIRQEKPTQAMVMLTAKGAEDDVVTGFQAGADDYISKPFSLRELMVRIEAVLRRAGKAMGDDRITHLGIDFNGQSLTAEYNHQSAELTRREMDIIIYLHRHQDRIVSKKELLREVWHYANTDIETRTVDIHVLKLRKKMTTLRPDGEFIQTVRGEGYRLETVP